LSFGADDSGDIIHMTEPSYDFASLVAGIDLFFSDFPARFVDFFFLWLACSISALRIQHPFFFSAHWKRHQDRWSALPTVFSSRFRSLRRSPFSFEVFFAAGSLVTFCELRRSSSYERDIFSLIARLRHVPFFSFHFKALVPIRAPLRAAHRPFSMRRKKKFFGK